MKKNTKVQNESGFVLIISMFVLVILSLIGIAATTTTTLELQIAGNDKVIRDAFHKADAGIENIIEVVEQNLLCPLGFSAAPAGFDNDDSSEASSFVLGGVDVFDNTFALDEFQSEIAGAPTPTSTTLPHYSSNSDMILGDIPSDTLRTLRIPADPANRVDTEEHTNTAAWGVTKYLAGSAIQMAAGYEGKGKGAATGGGSIVYEIHSQHIGQSNSEAILALQWVHVITGLVGCLY